MAVFSPNRRLRTGLKDDRGVAAIEFALVVAPMMFFLFAIIESGFIFIASIDLSNATMAVARQIRTGNLMAVGASATTSGVIMSLGDFKTAICNRMALVSLATCTAQLQVDLRTSSSFGTGQSATSPITNGSFSNASFCFYSGASASIVQLRAFYLWPVSTPILLNALVNATSYTAGTSTTSGSYHVIFATEAFKVEQNSSGSNTGSSC